MTYNVHSCIGMDGRVSPARIAQVLSRYDPDVVALQELDAGHARTGGDDQVQLIAEDLGFESLFCPTVCSGRAQYGIAVLSRYPLHLLNMARLPTGPKQACEPRAAMLASLRFGSDEIYVLNTHFGLGWSERAAQAAEILTDAWIGRFPEDAPLIVCGDFNMRPHSVTYRCLTKRLADVQAAAVKPSSANTFPSLWPVARIDHIFVSRGFRVAQARVPRSELTRVASDHLPLVADLEWPGELRQEKLGKPGSQALVDRP